MNKPPNNESAKILSCIGNNVKFRFPGNEGKMQGVLKDRVVVESTNANPGKVPYWDVVDLIEFDGQKERQWMRFGYYRKPKDYLNWGSQTTTTEPMLIWKRIFVKAAQEKKWFRALLEDVMKKLKN